jgi:hypothetical protein
MIEGLSSAEREYNPEKRDWSFDELYSAAAPLYNRYRKEHPDESRCYEYTVEFINKVGGTIEANLLDVSGTGNSHWVARFPTKRGSLVVDVTWDQFSDCFHDLGLHRKLKGPLILGESVYRKEIEQIV